MNSRVSPLRFQQFAHLLAGLTISVAYGFLAVGSRGPIGISLFPFLGGYWFVAAIIIVYWFWLRNNRIDISFRQVFIWAVIFRVIAIWGAPILEDDFHRYILDGCLFWSFGSPYGIIPSSLFAHNTLPTECQAALTWINNPDLPTIYAPMLQYLFAVSYYLAPANVDALQLIVVLFDLALIYLLRNMASARNILLYAWCPLVVKEFAFTAHPDVIGAFFVLAALSARMNGYRFLSCILIGIACCTKIFALLALPFILFRQPPRYWLTVLVTMVILYCPFLLQGSTDLTVLGYFAVNWQFNAILFELLEVLTSDWTARYLCGGLFLIWFCFYFSRYNVYRGNVAIPRMDWVFGLLLLASPVINPWYLVWLLPFAVLWPSVWAWTAAVVLSLSYMTGLHLPDSELGAYQIVRFAWVIEITTIGFALLFDYWRYRRRGCI